MIDSSHLPPHIRERSSIALKSLSLPLAAVGLEWIVSGVDKVASKFHMLFPAYATNLEQQKVFLPGLTFMARFPHQTAIFATILELAMGIALVWAAVVFWRRASRLWELVSGASILISTVVAFAIWLMDGRAPFWVDTSTNGYQSGWTVEFFLFLISLALTIGIAVAAPEVSPTHVWFSKTKSKEQRREEIVR